MTIHQEQLSQRNISSPGQAVNHALLFLLSVYGAVAFAVLMLAPHYFLPAEDAIILHQYSRNLAHHGVIAYYAGGPRAEGATDFGWMVLIAAAIRLGATPAWFSAAVNMISLLGLSCVLQKMARGRIAVTGLFVVAGSAALFPQLMAAVSGFAVLPESFLIAALVYAISREQVMISALMALLLCLFRPDGVVFAVPLLLAQLRPAEQRLHRVKLIVFLFILPGIVYFLWRAHYFSQLFPLPFLVKSDMHRTLGLLVPHSFLQSLKYLLFDFVLLFLLLRRPSDDASMKRMQGVLLVSLVVIPTLFYWTMRLDQNVGDRFFFYLPLAAAIILAMRWNGLSLNERGLLLRVGCAAFFVLILGPLIREIRSFRDFQFRSLQAVAANIGRIPTRGSLLTTEAGFLAYESDWIAYDAWGLNTARFARQIVQPQDVIALHPDLIALHPDMPESCLPQPNWQESYATRSWPNMTRNMVMGASRAGDYELWLLPYGSQFYQQRMHWSYGQGDRECFFIRRSSPRYAAMAAALQEQKAAGPPESQAMEQLRTGKGH